MKRFSIKYAVAALAALWAVSATAQTPQSDEYEQSCISIVVTAGASADGSVMTSHTCDGRLRTWIAVEPARDYPSGARRDVRAGLARNEFPSDTAGVRVVGWIPQARHTYKFINAAYPCMNEKCLGIGETTFGGPDTLRSSNGIFLIEELQAIALQRCSSAREAVQLMGSLAQEYGYIDGGECLTVADPREAWFFEIVGPGKGKKGAAWVAKRVPDGEVAVSANIPRIGALERENPDGFICSDNVEKVAAECGLWDGKSEFIFWKAFNCPFAKGRNFREREFYVLNEVAPSLGLKYTDPEMPFSVRPEKKVTVKKMEAMLRENFEGTEFDMTRNIKISADRKSPVANPWITPDWRNTLNYIAPGTVEFSRTVSVSWCAYSTIIQLRADLPQEIAGVCWFSFDNPGQSPHIPIFSGSTALPEGYDICGQKHYNPGCGLWKYRRANRLVTLHWQTLKEGFFKELLSLEDAAVDEVARIQSCAGGVVPSAEELNSVTVRIDSIASAKWSELEGRYWVEAWRGF